jgi:hypothetical protein
MLTAPLDKHTLLQLIDDCAAIFQNPEYYGIRLLTAPAGGINTPQGIPFRDRVLAQLARVSPKPEPVPPFTRNTRRGELVVPRHVVAEANQVLRHRIEAHGWSTEHWLTFAPEWTLKIWTRSGVHIAAIYRVAAGQIKGDKFWEIYRTGGWKKRTY